MSQIERVKAMVPITNGRMVPSDLEGVVRVSDMYLQSGLLPSGIKTLQAACVWATAVLELGIGFTAGLTGIAVVNGRPLLHSKLPLALAFKTGQFRGMEDAWTGLAPDGSLTESSVCRVVIRREVAGTVLEFTGTFGTADAKRAGLTGKGTHAQYPKDMIFHRAKSRALERGFPDALCGMGVIQPEDEDTAFAPRRVVNHAETTAPSQAAAAFAAIDEPSQPQRGAGPTDSERETPEPVPAPSALFDPDEIAREMDAPVKGRKL